MIFYPKRTIESKMIFCYFSRTEKTGLFFFVETLQDVSVERNSVKLQVNDAIKCTLDLKKQYISWYLVEKDGQPVNQQLRERRLQRTPQNTWYPCISCEKIHYYSNRSLKFDIL